MNLRRKFLLVFVSAICSAHRAFAQSSNPIRIAMVMVRGDASPRLLAAFRDGLRSQGYVDGVQLDERFMFERYELLGEAIQRLSIEKVNAIFCFGTSAAVAAAKAISSTPIVAVMSGDPVKLGLASSLGRPGRNLTGFTIESLDLGGKRLELLKDAFPGLRRVAVLFIPGSSAAEQHLESFRTAGAILNIEIHPVEIHEASAIDRVVGTLSRSKFDAISPVSASMFVSNASALIAAIEKTGLPVMYAGDEFTEAGGLFSYSPSRVETIRRAGVYVGRILKGAKPSELPIEQPTKHEFVVNLKAARRMKIRIPEAVLLRADRVI